MSEYYNILLISTPKTNTKEERKEARGYTCPECNGRKTFVTQTGNNEWEPYNCPYCEGAGWVMAEIKIHWMPDKENTRKDEKETGE
jgi:hypothetical protein